MGAVFVSYRRGDSEGQARALSLELVRLLGKDSVFMDVDSIALGRDFRQVLQERLASCDIMIALIGPAWLDAKDGSGARRIDSPTDFVRQEISAALKRNIPVIPVLVQGAQVPPPERLPDDLKDLSFRHGFELGHTTWESDVQELVKRLGLHGPNASDNPETLASSRDTRSDVPAGLAPSWQRHRVLAVIALLVGAAALATYGYSRIRHGDTSVTGAIDSPQSSPSSEPSKQTPLPSGGVAGTTPLARPAMPDSGLAASAIEFFWSGDDCWDISRGAEFVTYQCGAKKQALAAGRYTIKGRSAPVFTPFDVTVKPGTPTQIALGGVMELAWPGNDCWDIFRGAEFVTYQCGTKKQALGAGRYTIKGRSAPVFTPVSIDVKDGALTRVVMGGVLEFVWPGDDCWDIFRDAEPVTYQCGAKKQALSAGRYTLKGRSAPVFTPVGIDVKDGASTRLAMGGVFEFAWPGADCWDIFRGTEPVTYQCGAKKQALGAGRYTIKGRSAPVFEPFDIDITDGGRLVKSP